MVVAPAQATVVMFLSLPASSTVAVNGQVTLVATLKDGNEILCPRR